MLLGFVITILVSGAASLHTQTRGIVHPLAHPVNLTGHARRVRPIGPDARSLLEDARHRSATVRLLLSSLDGSDIIVYLQRGVFDRPSVEGRTSLITAVPDARFIRVVIRSNLPDDRAVEMFAHELQHVHEIALEPRVRSDSTLLQYLKAIGFECGTGRFETAAATLVERDVRSEFEVAKKQAR